MSDSSLHLENTLSVHLQKRTDYPHESLSVESTTTLCVDLADTQSNRFFVGPNTEFIRRYCRVLTRVM